LADEAVAFVQDTTGPLFLELATSAPHAPAIPSPGDESSFASLSPARPPSFDEADVSEKPAWVRDLPPLTPSQEAAIDAFRADQYRSLLGVDRALGRILDALERAGRLENTLIVFTSDNGILHGEHRWTKKEAPYEEAIRVPLVMRWDAAGWAPGTELPGVLALNIDLAPTIAEAAGVAHPPTDGRSLLPVLAGDRSSTRSDFLIEHMEGENPVPTFCAVRSERWTYVRSRRARRSSTISRRTRSSSRTRPGLPRCDRYSRNGERGCDRCAHRSRPASRIAPGPASHSPSACSWHWCCSRHSHRVARAAPRKGPGRLPGHEHTLRTRVEGSDPAEAVAVVSSAGGAASRVRGVLGRGRPRHRGDRVGVDPGRGRTRRDRAFRSDLARDGRERRNGQRRLSQPRRRDDRPG